MFYGRYLSSVFVSPPPQYIPPKDFVGISMHSGVFVHGSHIHSPATSESFSAAKEHLSAAEEKCLEICKEIEVLPTQGKLKLAS